MLVPFVTPSGDPQLLTDAHNILLSLAAQCGLGGLAALLGLTGAVAWRSRPLRLDGRHGIVVALGLAWLNGWLVQGLSGSFEDSRHLWLLLGLWLAAGQIGLGSGLVSRASMASTDASRSRRPAVTAPISSA